MLLEDQLPALLGELATRAGAPDPELVAGARRRHGRRRATRLTSAAALVVLLASGTAVGFSAQRSPRAGDVLKPADTSDSARLAVAAGDVYASVEQGTHDLILISADTGAHMVLRHTAPGDPVPATAVVSPSRHYVYYLTDPRTGDGSDVWRIPIDGGDPERLPSGPHSGPNGAGGLGVSNADLVISPDDTEYAYPDFAEPQGVYIQAVKGGAPEHTLDTPPDTARATPIGWLDDTRLAQLGEGSAPGGAFMFVGDHHGEGQVLQNLRRHSGETCHLAAAAALLADGRVLAGSGCVGSRHPESLSAISTTGALLGRAATPTTSIWAGPDELAGFGVLDITPLPDGRALVRYDNGHCGAKPFPTLTYSPDGSFVPAYGAPASALHC